MSYGVACVMMIVDSILYGLIGAYVRSVFPGKGGRRKPFWYPCLPSTWCFCKRKSTRSKLRDAAYRAGRDSQPNPFTIRMKRMANYH